MWLDRMMSDYKVEMVNDGMSEFYVEFHGPRDSTFISFKSACSGEVDLILKFAWSFAKLRQGFLFLDCLLVVSITSFQNRLCIM